MSLKILQINHNINLWSNDVLYFCGTFCCKSITVEHKSYIVDNIENINRIILLSIPSIIIPCENIYYTQKEFTYKTSKAKYIVEKKLHMYVLNYMPPTKKLETINSPRELYKSLLNIDFVNDFTGTDFDNYIIKRLNMDNDIIDKNKNEKINKFLFNKNNVFDKLRYLENESILE